MTLRLHDYSASGNCYKVRLLLAQLDRAYERVPVDIFAGDTLTDDFGRLTPVRETPVLQEEGADPLPESNAILPHPAEGSEYLPDSPAERAQVLRWLFGSSRSDPRSGGLRFRLKTGRLAPDSPGMERRRAGGHAVLRLLDDHLGHREFMLGERYWWPTSRSTLRERGPRGGFDLQGEPAVVAWLERVQSTPRFMNDFEPYPLNSHLGQSRSIYD